MPPKKVIATVDSKHEFWDTQPVPKLAETVDEEGPMENKTVADVPKEPYPIASVLEWFTPNMMDDDDLNNIYELLSGNYVEDDDSIFRFNYSKEFLRWANTPPGYHKDWMVSVRKKGTKQALAFIAGVPITVRVGEKTMLLCEINFLCVHKVLRSKRLAPILIKEVTRRVNLLDIWQAVYTAGIELPKPIVTCQYYHRSLNPEKLVAIGFSRIPANLQKLQRPMEAMKKTLALAEKPALNLRVMTKADVPAVTKLLAAQLAKYRIAPMMSDEDVHHWLLPRETVVFSYVVEDKTGTLTDFVSFYGLPSTVLGNAKYTDLRAAYCFYYASTSAPLSSLVADALILARDQKFDVFNMLSIMENLSFQDSLKFGMGDGYLRYYFYNWKFPTITPSELGLVML